jgi:periplasmic protein CpxP/Spy
MAMLYGEDFCDVTGLYEEVLSAPAAERKAKEMKTQNIAKKLLTVAGLLAVGTFAPLSFAQTGGQEQSSPPAAQQEMKGHGNPYEGLNLTDDQKAQIKKIHMEAKARADVVRGDRSLSDADKQTKVKEIHKAARMEADKVLTPEQRAQMKEKMKDRREEKQNPS